MNDKEPVYNWAEVMGNNMIYPTRKMLYMPTILYRKTRLKREGKYGKVRVLKVSHDLEFVVWRLCNLLRELDSSDEPKLREVFELVLRKMD